MNNVLNKISVTIAAPTLLVLIALATTMFQASVSAQTPTYTSHRTLEDSKYLHMNIVVNCHDFSQVQTSYTTLSRLFAIYRKYGLIADFYFTDMLAQRLERHKPGFLDSLRRAGMGINIHHRAPHALTFRPSQRDAQNPQSQIVSLFRAGRTDEAFAECEKWERKRVNVSTGGLDSAVGGYDFIEQKSGTKPVCVGFGISGNFDSDSLAIASLYALKKVGLRATVDEHEGGADAVYPFMTTRGVLARPTDISVTRWAAGTAPRDTFWWKMVLTPNADAYSPRRYLEQQIGTLNKSQLNICNAILHETDFSYDRPPFYSVYYVEGTSGATNRVPYDTNAFPLDRVIPWSQVQKDAIWAKYDSLMQYISQHPNIRAVTLQTMLSALSDDRERPISREQCRNIASQIVSASQTTTFRMPSKNFYVTGTYDYFSLADAYYALQRALADYRANGRLPETLNLRDVAPPFGTGTGLTANATFTWAEAGQAISAQSTALEAQIAVQRYGGRMPTSVSIGSRSLSMLEYLCLLARAYQAVDASTTAPTSVEARQLSTPAVLLPPPNDQSQNGASNWSIKPLRRLASNTTIGVSDKQSASESLSLFVSPNPISNSELRVQFTLSRPERVNLTLYNIRGQAVATAVSAVLAAGEQEMSFSADALPQGAYTLQLEVGTQKMSRIVHIIR